MMTETEIKTLLQNKPVLSWEGEPLLGGTYGQEEIDAAVAAMRDSFDISRGFGFSAEPIRKFEEEFAAYCGTRFACAVNSAGPGLDIVMRALNLQPGDEVILPSINYDAAPLAVLGAGGKVVWGEVRESDLLLDPADVERKITARTRAIFPVHIHGLSAPMDDYLAIAQKYARPSGAPIRVIGDAARATGGDYNGTKVGKKGWASVFSLQTMKNMSTLGEGGMIVTDDPELDQYAHSVRMYGREVAAWGTSNVMTKVQGAVGRVQLRKLDGFIAGRRKAAAERTALLAGTPRIALPQRPLEHSFYLYPILLDASLAGAGRDKLISLMKSRHNIACMIANPPVYEVHPYVDKVCGRGTPVSEALSRRIVCLPIHPQMSGNDNRYITAAFLSCLMEL